MNLYTTFLSRAIDASDLHETELDETLFRPLLLALLSRRKHVIVRSPEEDIPRILKSVVHVLHTILSLSVLKLKLRPTDKDTLSPEDFLRLLFLRVPANPELSSRPGSRKASALNDSLSGTLPFKRSSSYPNTAYSLDEFHAHSRFLSENRSLFRSQTDPLQNPFSHNGSEVSSNELPQALVLSGLEHTSTYVQEALWRVMSQNTFTLAQSSSQSAVQMERNRSGSAYEDLAESHKEPTTWNLDENFLVVYVCPIQDGRERPPIHKSLIDRFALCVDVDGSSLALSPKPQFGRLQSDDQLPSKPPGLVLSPSDFVQIQRILFPPSPLSILSKTPLSTNHAHSPLASRPSLLLADLLSAIRHHPHLDGSLLSARCHTQCVDLVRAHHMLFGALSAVGQEPTPEGIEDEDVRRVVCALSAVVHRLRVREGPEDEVLASAVYPAVRGETGGRAMWREGRRTVKEILKEVVESFG